MLDDAVVVGDAVVVDCLVLVDAVDLSVVVGLDTEELHGPSLNKILSKAMSP